MNKKDVKTKRAPQFFETREDKRRAYNKPPSLSIHLPWVDADDENHCFLLADGVSVGAGLLLDDVGCEAKSADFLAHVQQMMRGVFQVFDEYHDDGSPWIVQCYSGHQAHLHDLSVSVAAYAAPEVTTQPFTQDFLQRLREHGQFISQPQGIFTDNSVTGLPFQGKKRQHVLLFYRHLSSKKAKRHRERTPMEDVCKVRHGLITKLRDAGLSTQVMTAHFFYQWMVRWFNPNPRATDGDVDALLRAHPYPPADARPFGFDLSQQCFYHRPRSEQGLWYFDDMPHRYVPISGLTRLPSIGHVFLPRQFNTQTYSVFDTLPPGSLFTMTVVIRSQTVLKKHLERTLKNARMAKGAEGHVTLRDCEQALLHIEEGNAFYPTTMGVYLRADNITALQRQSSEVASQLTNHGFRVIEGDDDVTPLDNYIKFLPLNYDYAFDKKWQSKARHLSITSLANLLPVYGRDRGTGNPGFIAFNRGGEPFLVDPLNKKDKASNSHTLILGTTGAGKSALAIYNMMTVMALYRPRILAVDAGNSFEHLCGHFQRLGVSVHRVVISHEESDSVSLNPFADSEQLLAQFAKHQQRQLAKTEAHLQADMSDDAIIEEIEESSGTITRDHMAEMTLACSLMITGCDPHEKPISRMDKRYIMDALLKAANAAKAQSFNQMIPSDVARAFVDLAACAQQEGRESVANRLQEMSSGIALFCQDPLTARYFDTRGEPWPSVDVTVFELGLFKDSDEYTAQRTLAFVTLMNRALSVAEHYQHKDNRDTIFVGDECHLLTQNIYSAASLTRCSKMSRKVGLWLWLLSQNINDFSDNSRKMLSMMEFVFCLSLSDEEIHKLSDIIHMSAEDKRMLQAVRKESGKYVEGVVLSKKVRALFRNVPLRLSLALAMTEKSEKAELYQLAKTHDCNLLEAIYIREQQLLGKAVCSNA